MTLTRRDFVRLGGLSAVAAFFTGCDDGVTEQIAQMLDDNPDSFAPPVGDDVDLATHVMNRCTFGPTSAELGRINAIGVEKWLEAQLAPDAIDDSACDVRCMGIESIHLPAAEMYECNEHRLLYDLTRNKILRAVYSHRQLFEVMVDHWTDQFNIFAFKQDCRWLKPAEDRDVIRAHALSNFRNLVHASAVNAAMLIYLDGHDNKVIKPDDHPNENSARELLELHTMGVGSGYTQRDIMEVARCLTGWTYANQPFRLRAAHVGFDASRHDGGAKDVLGVRIPAGGGADDLERVLDVVCAHPATAKYQATRLCRRFVADPPPSDAVATVTDAFTQAGGDIAATLAALFACDAFRDSANRANRFKRPFEFVISALRATGATTDGREPIMEALERMGNAPHQYPTPDGYPLEEAPWLGTLLWRWRFVAALAQNNLKGTTLESTKLASNPKDATQFAGRAWGRKPTDEERTLILGPGGVGLALAAPAFMYR